MSGGTVGIFDQKTGPPPRPELYLRFPDHVGDLDEDGVFRVEVPTGSYYVGAMQAQPDKQASQPREGDYLLVIKGDDGKPKLFKVGEQDTLDIGVNEGGEVFVPTEDIALNNAAIRGRITAANGNPVGGVILIGTDMRKSLDSSPGFFSKATGDDGMFQIAFPGPGTYRVRLTLKQESVHRFSLNNKNAKIKIENESLLVTLKENRLLDGIDLTIN